MTTSDLRSMRIRSNKCIERLVLPPPGSSRTEFANPAITFSNLSVVAGKPHVGLLFVAPGMYWGREENRKLEQEVVEEYGRYFGGKLIAVGCNECLTEGDVAMRSCAGPRGPATGTTGLLFWPSDGLRVRVSHDDVALHRFIAGEQRILVPNNLDGLVGQLELGDQEDSALLVFANAFPAFVTATACLFSAIETRFNKKTMSMWGGYFNDDVSVAENIGADNCLIKDALFVLIRLSGPRLKSASTIIRCTNTRRQVDSQLRLLRRRWQLRRRSILLMSGPVNIGAGEDCYSNCREFKLAAKRIFGSDVQILGAFSNLPHAIGVDTCTDNGKFSLFYKSGSLLKII